MTNSLVLKAEILRNGLTFSELAKEMGISYASLSYKVNNKREFNQSEISSICSILNLDDASRNVIFFGKQVDETSTLDKTVVVVR